MKEALIAALVILALSAGAALAMYLFVRSLIVIGDAL